jgi:hypothetical protein
MFARKELTEAEKEAKEQYTLSKHRLLRFLFSHTYYEVSAAVVVAAAVILTGLDPETSEALVPQAETEKSIVELVFFLVFVLDFMGKALTFGIHSPLILGGIWGWIDLGVILSMAASVIQTALNHMGISALPMRTVRLLRVLRIFALLPRLERVRHSLSSILAAKRLIFCVTVLIFLLAFVAAVIGLELMTGGMVTCTSNYDVHKRDCVGSYMTIALDEEQGLLSWAHAKQHVPSEPLKILAPRSWHRTKLNFDDFYSILRVVMVIGLPSSTTWLNIAEDAMRVQGNGDIAMHSGAGSGFKNVVVIGWVIFLLHMLLYNFLIATLIKHVRETNGLAMLTSAQKAWQTTLRLVQRSCADKTSARIKSTAGLDAFKDYVDNFEDRNKHTAFTCICFCDSLILFNWILLCLPTVGYSLAASYFGKVVGVGLALSMGLEQVLLLLYHGGELFGSPELVMDCGVVLVGIAEALSMFQPSCFLMLRVPKLIMRVTSFRTKVPQLAELLEVLQSYWHSLQICLAALIVLSLWILIFAIIGVDFFGGTKYDRNNVTYQTSFDALGNSLELLFRLAVGGEYIGVIDALSVQPPFCTPDPFIQGNVVLGGRFGDKLVVPDIGKFVPYRGDCGHAGAGMPRALHLPLSVSALLFILFENILH